MFFDPGVLEHSPIAPTCLQPCNSSLGRLVNSFQSLALSNITWQNQHLVVISPCAFNWSSLYCVCDFCLIHMQEEFDCSTCRSLQAFFWDVIKSSTNKSCNWNKIPIRRPTKCNNYYLCCRFLIVFTEQPHPENVFVNTSVNITATTVNCVSVNLHFCNNSFIQYLHLENINATHQKSIYTIRNVTLAMDGLCMKFVANGRDGSMADSSVTIHVRETEPSSLRFCSELDALDKS